MALLAADIPQRGGPFCEHARQTKVVCAAICCACFLDAPEPRVITSPNAHRGFARTRRMVDSRGQCPATGEPYDVAGRCVWQGEATDNNSCQYVRQSDATVDDAGQRIWQCGTTDDSANQCVRQCDATVDNASQCIRQCDATVDNASQCIRQRGATKDNACRCVRQCGTTDDKSNQCIRQRNSV